MSVNTFICLSIHLSVNLLVHPSVHHFIHLSNYIPNLELSVCIDVCLSLQQSSLCLSPNPFMCFYASVYATLSVSQFLCISHKLSVFSVPLSEFQQRLIHICNSFFFFNILTAVYWKTLKTYYYFTNHLKKTCF
jgi:hypothetical protein